MPPRRFPVEWEIAEDERFRHVVERGIELATPDFGHSVHAEPRGLRPAASYFYRFRVDGQISPVGRTRTAPSRRSSPQRLRLAFASCQDFQAGFYSAYRGMAAEDVDLVVHLGTEFVGTSISSDFPAQFIPAVTAALPDNPHTKFFDGALRGYVRCDITPQQWTSTFRVVDTALVPGAPTRTLATFAVENGRPGAQLM